MKILKLTLIGDELFYSLISLNKLKNMYACINLFQSVNKFSFPNRTALKSIHTFVTRTSMTAFDHYFKSQG